MLIKSSFLLKHKKIIIIISSLFLVTVIVLVCFFFSKGNNVVAAGERKIAKVTKGDLSVNITGSSSIASSESTNISSEVSSTVTSISASVGDRVSKGDVLMTFDASAYNSSLKSSQKDVTNSQTKVNELKEDISNLNVKAINSGYVSNLKYKVGDSVSKNSELFTITDTSSYIINCDFYYNSAVDIKVGDSASLFLPNTFARVSGVVTFVSDLKSITNGNAQTQSVEIEVKNPGYSLEGTEAIATVTTATKDIQSSSSATFEEGNKITFKCPSSGTIKSINIRNGSYVSAGDLVIVLENDDLYESLSDAQSSLDIAYEKLSETKIDSSLYTITAPIDGLITELSVETGDQVRDGTSLIKIVNNYAVGFDIDVDELDISNVKLGQEVKVTIDAIEETTTNPIIGTVSNIAIEGTSVNSVTSYPVTISFEGNDEIKIGMNASAEIVIDSCEDVLLLPVEAITSRKNKHYVTMQNNTEVEVETGLYNEDYIEIKSGLSEGDMVLLPATVSGNNSTTKTQTQSQGGFMNSFNGGSMPSNNSVNGRSAPSGRMPGMM